MPKRPIGGSFADEPLSRYGFERDWTVKPQWNLRNTPGTDDVGLAESKVKTVSEFLAAATPPWSALTPPSASQ